MNKAERNRYEAGHCRGYERSEQQRVDDALASLTCFSGGVIMHTPVSARAYAAERVIVITKEDTVNPHGNCTAKRRPCGDMLQTFSNTREDLRVNVFITWAYGFRAVFG